MVDGRFKSVHKWNCVMKNTFNIDFTAAMNLYLCVKFIFSCPLFGQDFYITRYIVQIYSPFENITN